jgi:hypothetical protein
MNKVTAYTWCKEEIEALLLAYVGYEHPELRLDCIHLQVAEDGRITLTVDELVLV